MRIAPQTSIATASAPGNRPGPTFCPGMRGKPCTCQRIAAPRSANSTPQTASLSFTTESLRFAQDGFAASREVT